MSTNPLILFARRSNIFLAFLDMVLVLCTYSYASLGELWWGTIVGFLLSLLIFVGYICSLTRKKKPNMANRAFLALFPAVFLLGLKFVIIDALIRSDYDMADCHTNSRCHAFKSEITFSVVLGFMVVFEVYATLRREEQRIVSEQQAAFDIESQRSPTQVSSTATSTSTFVGFSMAHPNALPGQSDPEKPRVDTC